MHVFLKICTLKLYFRARIDALVKVTQEETEKLRRQEMLGT